MTPFVKCHKCGERLREADLSAHYGLACASADLTYKLFAKGLRPLPMGHSVPGYVVGMRLKTRGAYDGEPREEVPLLDTAVEQDWIERWSDIIVSLWSGSIYLEGEPRVLQRNQVLFTIATSHTHLQERVVDAYAEDLRAVRETVKPVILGTPPLLLSEVERRGRPL